MSKISKISGFPEWLPEQKLVEDRVIGGIRTIYESFGFTPIDTPAVELLSTLGSKGVIDKEIYAVRRFQGDGDGEAELGLRFDLTVPLARYVAQHAHHLVFPFKRYQLQKVWRGDRPQKGRFREFYQFDADIIGRDELPLAADAEVLTIIDRAIASMQLGAHVVRVNNRKVLQGFYGGLGLDEAGRKAAIIAVDKIDKIGAEGVRAELMKISGMSAAVADRMIAATALKCPPDQLRSNLGALNVENDLLDQGIAELEELFRLVPRSSAKNFTVDFSLARGLEYYTGVICEASIVGHPEFGTVASGGRYDNLASEFTDQKLPGVGISIGLTRLMELVFENNILPTGPSTPSKVLVTVLSETQRPLCNDLADNLRNLGVSCEVFLKSPKLGKQIEYAEKKGIRYVLFAGESGGTLRIKDLVTKDQKDVASLAEWSNAL